MKLHSVRTLLPLLLLLFLGPSPRALSYYDPGAQRWLNRDPVEEQGFRLLFRAKSKPLHMQLNGWRYVSNDPVSSRDAFGLTDYSGIDDVVKASGSLEDCLDGCDNLRQKDLQRLVGPASAERTKGTLVGGGVIVVGGLLSLPLPSRPIGYVLIGGGVLYCVWEWYHNTKNEEKGEEETKDRFGRCCAGCGDRWGDIDTALHHFQQIYPTW